MYSEIPPDRCKDCGSTRSETFHRKNESGIRCLNCGHEIVKKAWTPTDTKGTSWVSDKTGNYF